MKYALLIGLNYYDSPYQLNGCINDVNNMAAFLVKKRNYDPNKIRIMTDGPQTSPTLPDYPTKQNILAAIDAFVGIAKAGDELFFHYSGHGSLVRDANGDEVSGMDSCLCPVDCATGNVIIDDEIRSRLANKVPTGARLYVVLDCCHNGTGVDLRFVIQDFSVQDARKNWIIRQTLNQNTRYQPTAGEVYMISGCADNQTSADAVINNIPAGALTHGLLSIWNAVDFNSYNWSTFLKDLRVKLRSGGFTQIPQLMLGKTIIPTQRVFSEMAPGPTTVASAVNAIRPSNTNTSNQGMGMMRF